MHPCSTSLKISDELEVNVKKFITNDHSWLQVNINQVFFDNIPSEDRERDREVKVVSSKRKREETPPRKSKKKKK